MAAECPVCFASSVDYFTSGRDRLFHSAPGRFQLLRCRQCRCVFQDPIPGDQEIPSFYPRPYWRPSEEAGSSALSKAVRRLETAYREFVAMDHVRFLDRCARDVKAAHRKLLDIGCGSGLVLHLARRPGFEPFGMDVSEQAVGLARGRYGLDVRQGKIGDHLWPPGEFDFVTMFHVLEHLRDPRAALRYVRAILKRDGNLILQVPNLDSLQARCFGARWYGLDVPRHLINFTPAAIDLLLKDAGFKVARRARFSLRDNPASIASSLAIGLDPVGRSAREEKRGALGEAMLEIAYTSLVFVSLPLAALESALGFGGTIWVHARPTE